MRVLDAYVNKELTKYRVPELQLTMSNSDIEELFKNLDEKEQWNFVFANKDIISLSLDNDNTTICIGEEEDDNGIYGELKLNLAYFSGIIFLLKSIGIKSSQV